MTDQPSEAAIEIARQVHVDCVRHGNDVRQIALALDRHAAAQREKDAQIAKAWLKAYIGHGDETIAAAIRGSP